MCRIHFRSFVVAIFIFTLPAPRFALAQRKGDDLPKRVPAKQDMQPKGLAGVGLTAEQVNAAIDKGSAFLWNYIKENDLKGRNKLGSDRQHLLCSLALVHSGAHKKYSDFDAALRDLLSRYKADEERDTYNAGIFCMLVESYGDPMYYPQMQRAARYLMEAQGPGGTWTYNPKVPPEIFKVPAEQDPLQVSGGVPLDGTGASAPWTRVTKPETQHDQDNSVAQYGLLGLHSAARSGIKLPPEVWQRNLDTERKRQSKDGGWDYTQGGSSYGSMTSAGICSIAINRYQLGEKDVNDDEAIEKGLGWLDHYFTVEKNPGKNQYHYYYLYSLERVGRILDTEFFGSHEWYPLGARFLVDHQQADGRWESKLDDDKPRLATSFALLFLTRATPSLNVAAKRGGNGTLRTAAAASSDRRIYIILDASGSMIDQMGDKRKFDVARGAVQTLIEGLPDGTEVGLRVYGHRKSSIEPGADQDTELVIPFGPLNKKNLLAKLKTLRPRGRTPLTLSLNEARKDLPRSGDPVTVVLLTDGGEDTFPRQDPVKAAKEFSKSPNLRLNIVGFDVASHPEWIKQLHDMTTAANGRYYPAAEGETLMKSLRSAVYGTPDNFTVAQGDKEIGKGEFGSSMTLPEGKYTLQTEYAGKKFHQDFWINTDAVTVVVFDAGKVPPDAPVAK